MSNPIVSVVMVTRNVQRFLVEAIESILAQTFRDFEFLIVDFGSSDDSKKIIKKYADADARVRSHEVAPCSLTEARNSACFLARGKYIAIMDADDVSLADRLYRQVRFMEKNPGIALAGGLAECINASGKPLGFQVHLNPPTGHQEITAALNDHCPFCHPTLIFWREAFAAVGGYRPVLEQAEDYDLCARISERFLCAGLSEVVLRYRVHPQQLSMNKQKLQSMYMLAARASTAARRSGKADPLDSIAEITPETLEGFGISKAVQQRELSEQCQNWIRFSCMAGEYDDALKGIVEFLSSDLQYVEKRRISDLHLTLAWLYWRRGAVVSSGVEVGRGVVARPASAARPLKNLLRWARAKKTE